MMQQDLLDQLITILLAIKTKDEMNDFLEGLLTPKELAELPQRIQIVKQLLQNVPQHKIAANLRVGVATVSRGSRELKRGKFKILKENDYSTES